jgi:hypothetical protein
MQSMKTATNSALRTLALASFAVAMLCLAPGRAWALGQKEAPREPATGLSDWEHDFDISTLSPGLYNIVVTGTDVAGNAAQGGPINVYVDPNSDLPIVSVINPTPLQRVGGDLNIVGACVDDDGVARVEVSVDGGDFAPATGGEFWSLYLGTKDLQDGRRELAIRGVDINGVVGPTVKVAFNLDRSKPAAGVGVPEPGALVAGQIKLEGSVYDANGVAGLELSTDGGKVFAKVSLKKDKPGTTGTFSVALDTRKFPDGPRVLWLRSVDGVGSKGSAAFLIFVDNTKPAIDLALPRAGATVNGMFAVAGAVRDAVGIARLSYEFAGTDRGEIPLVPGNPYFSREFDAAAVKGDKAQLVLIAEDRIGNITRLELSPKIDREADKPRVVVAFPAPGGVVKTAEAVWGAIADDDGGAAIVYSLDGGAAQELPASDVFSIPAAGLSAGRHLLSIRAKDIHGALGDPMSLPVVVDAGRASVSFLRVAATQASKGGAAPASASSAADYRPGMAFRVDAQSALEGAIESANALVSASYTVAGGAERPLALVKGPTATSYAFRIALDRSMPYGFTAIEVKAVDAVGNSGSGRALLYSVDLSAAREDSGFAFDDPRIAEGGRVALSPGDSLLGAFYREDIDSIKLDPPTDIVAVSFEGRTVAVKAAREGVSPATRLVARTKRGHEFRSDPFVFACDATAPRISIDSPAEGTWHSSAFVLKGKIADAGGIASASLRIGKDGEPRTLALAADGSFSASLSPADLPQGALLVEVLAADASGNTGRAERSLGFDSEAPSFSFLSPTAGAEVHGPEDVAAILSDVSGIASVEYAADGKAFAPVEFRGQAFIHRADLAANPKAAYRVTDRAGNSAVARPEVAVVAKPAAIAVSDSVSVEAAEAAVKLSLSGTAGSRKVGVSLPGLPEADFQGLGFAEREGESGGFKPAPVRFALHLLASGSLSLKGSVAASASVKSVSVSFDGGATYSNLFLAKDAKAIVAEAPVSLSVDTTKLKDGEVRWIVKVEDGAGALAFAPLYAVVDNGKPDISLVAPPTSLTGVRPVVARILDAWGLASAAFTVAGQKKDLAVAEGGSFHAAWAEPAQPAAAAAGGSAAAKPQPLAVALEARDAAGNAASLSVPIPYDAAADTPRIDLSIPTAAPAGAQAAAAAAPAFVAPQDRITCYASDDDPAPVLRLVVDSGEPVSFPTSAFGLALAGLAPGRHSLQVEALDSGGRSAAVKKDFVVMGPAPAFDAVAAGAAGAAAPWFPGMELEIVQGVALSGTVNAANGLASLEYSVNGGAPAKALIDKGGQAFSCPFPAGLAYDRVTVELRARDLAGLETLRRYSFHNILKAAAGAPPADTADALRFFDAAIGATGLPGTAVSAGTSSAAAPATAPAAAGAAGAAQLPVLLLAPGASVEGFWNGRPLKSLSIEAVNGGTGASAAAAASGLAASWDGGQVKLTASAETIVSGRGLVLKAETVDGDRFEWGPFALAVDASAPTLAVDLPLADSYEKGIVRIAGRAEDANGVVSVEVSVNGGAFAPLPASLPVAVSPTAPTAAAAPAAGKSGSAPAAAAKPAPAAPKPAAAAAPAPAAAPAGPARSYAFDLGLPLAAAEDGAVRLDIVARDAAGKETHVLRYITKDTVAPALTQVLPAPGESVNGTTTFIGEAQDAGRVASINFLAGPGPKKDSPAPLPEPVSGAPVFAHTIDLAKTAFPLPEGAGFVVADKAGNVSVLQPQIVVDLEKDKPVVEIQSPSELEVLRANYVISGAVYDDDGVAALYYRIDGGDWARVEVKGASFSIPKTLAESVDNEHLVEAYAEDIYGVKSDTASRRFRISKEEPTALMAAPSIDKPVRGVITLSGSAQDANGIASVAISFDNGASWEAATGAESWSYPLDTKILKDGLHPIALRPLDKYDTEGFYATFLSVDNTPPEVEISLPADGVAYSGTMPLSGRVSDNVRLAEVRLEIAPIGNGKPPLVSIPLELGPVIGKDVDLSALPAGAYTVRLVARDRADNETFASRDIVVRLDKPEDRVELLFPVQGDEASGRLRVYGRAVVAGGASSATILVDGADVGTAPLDPLGYFAFDIPADKLAAGPRAIMARAMGADGKAVSSQVATLAWSVEGPWVTVDSLNAGAYVPERPWLSGHAGWTAAAPDPKDAAAMAAFKKAAAARKVILVEVSLDNGRTWEKARGGEAWKFRLETLDYPEGGLHVIVRARYGDGSTRTAKTVLSLDKTPPEVRLLEPLENGRFNGVIHAAGAASDESGLSSVGLSLRKGDKRGYELPAFIQGLYLDGHVYGATYWDVGAGLSFFQDNVKLQVMLGQAPADGRFGGNVYGAKLLANIFYLPASFLLGPDWSFLSASFAVGANFSYFSTSTSGEGLVLGAVVAQVEFPKLTIKDWTFMRKISFYTEGQAWFVSSDVQGGIEFRMAFGLRLGLF